MNGQPVLFKGADRHEMDPDGGYVVSRKRMIGSGNGLRKNPVLCGIVEEMFGAKLALAECEEEAATGAALSSMQQDE